MKLVEILAQEVEEWPETTYWYAQDEDGMTFPWVKKPHFCGDEWEYRGEDKEYIDYIDLNQEAQAYDFDLASDYDTAIVTKGMWLAEKNKMAKGSVGGEVDWQGGVDLPPVGVECIHVYHSSCEVVKILAHTVILG